MTRQLVLVHGRSQQGKQAGALKQEWIEALSAGMEKNGLTLPIDEADIRFPYFGDTLDGLARGRSAEEVADIVVRGDETDPAEKEFMQAVLTEVKDQANLNDADLAEVADPQIVGRGPGEWEWLQAVLRAIDRKVPFGSGASIALATNDVYKYIQYSIIRQKIDAGVTAAFTLGVETVVVGHSLGSVIAYNVLRQNAKDRGWSVPLLVTIGSPLGVNRIRNAVKALAAPTRCPEGVLGWFNAMDERDIVALYPLTSGNFPLDPDLPAIENKTDVRNRTANRHGVVGYLEDPEVARRIHEALSA